ncbi:MAG: DUF2262 domain-containing protein [Planctomycetales bacterium]|nr:DUF2262 domain-containing protein [Planctomycetales bacterium]
MAKRKAKPKPPADDIDDKVLGLLRFTCHVNPRLDEFEGSVAIGNQSVQLILYTDEALDLTATIKRTHELLRRHNAIMKRAAKYAADHILPHYNEVWQTEGSPKLTRKSLTDHIKVVEMTVHPDGRATYWYDAGDLFDGHGLRIFLSAETNFVDHDTPG